MILWFVRSVKRGGVGGYFGWFLILTVGGWLVVMFWVLFVFSFSCFCGFVGCSVYVYVERFGIVLLCLNSLVWGGGSVGVLGWIWAIGFCLTEGCCVCGAWLVDLWLGLLGC